MRGKGSTMSRRTGTVSLRTTLVLLSLVLLWSLQSCDWLDSLLEVETEEEEDVTNGESATCAFSSWPVDPSTDFTTVGLSWCPVSVDFQVRVHAIQTAGAYCAIAHGTSSTAAQIAARHAEINASCDLLEAWDNNRTGGASCLCPSGYRP